MDFQNPKNRKQRQGNGIQKAIRIVGPVAIAVATLICAFHVPLEECARALTFIAIELWIAHWLRIGGPSS